MQKIFKIIGISLITFCFIYFIFYAMYMNGFFIKEKYSGIIVNSLLVGDHTVGNNIYMDDINEKSEIVLSLSECKDKNIQLHCGWNYEYKYYEKTQSVPEVKYKEIEYSITKDDNLYTESERSETIFTEYGSSRDFTNFNFRINEIGEYEITINLFIKINNKNHSQIRKFKIIVNE